MSPSDWEMKIETWLTPLNAQQLCQEAQSGQAILSRRLVQHLS